jgi:ribosome maturation factor RimP
MKELKHKIISIAETECAVLDFLLIDVEFAGDNRNMIFRFFVDNLTGITADDCAILSSAIAKQIEEQDIVPSSYRIEVSSPGLDRPLKYLKQYPKSIGRKFEISYEEEDGDKTLTGKLLKIEDEELYFQVAKEEIKINFNKIKNAKVVISF